MAEQASDPWRIIWRFVTSDGVLVILLLAVASGVTVTAWIPQRPSSDADYARWLSQAQARFGNATSILQSAGLFDVTGSLAFRVVLALLSGCLSLRLVERVDRLWKGGAGDEPGGEWRELSQGNLSEWLGRLRQRRYRAVERSSFYQVDRWPWADVSVVVAHAGALLLLSGLLFSYLWGWQVEGLVLQEGERASLPGDEGWVGLSADGDGTDHSSGVVTFIEERGPGVRVQAVGSEGETLQLQLSAEAEPSAGLLVALAEDAYFAVPEANLITRLRPRSDEPYTRVDVEIYRSPPGEIISETVTREGGDAELTIEGVRLELTAAPYVRLTVSRNPGRWPAILGVILLTGGLLANLAWPTRRFWLREREGRVEAAGPFPPSLTPSGEEA